MVAGLARVAKCTVGRSVALPRLNSAMSRPGDAPGSYVLQQ